MANIPVHIKMLIDEHVRAANRFILCRPYECDELMAEKDDTRAKLEAAIKKYNDDAIKRARKS